MDEATFKRLYQLCYGSDLSEEAIENVLSKELAEEFRKKKKKYDDHGLLAYLSDKNKPKMNKSFLKNVIRQNEASRRIEVKKEVDKTIQRIKSYEERPSSHSKSIKERKQHDSQTRETSKRKWNLWDQKN
ncbi:hypothetical protein ROZALSC1DRAFT_26522 [Rozella allomycis CSF55]|uniref:Uncharacterized protein n=1 Tax=Rozella allomycis (strain CSF55) TaxID=988480 RepID=A0A075B1N6_ROZAC|nr:hypothetical protein O9G_003324 [Rozella allomycis CSF55]RKP22096.1 hypothetical protein ROZALSC1DRAFT_26522 [Rozella allomycis CSF55]|eukprot:EPZ36453.1 hypothetical protein O9G_003324 [Rozella allomycis CSF55]